MLFSAIRYNAPRIARRHTVRRSSTWTGRSAAGRATCKIKVGDPPKLSSNRARHFAMRELTHEPCQVVGSDLGSCLASLLWQRLCLFRPTVGFEEVDSIRRLGPVLATTFLVLFRCRPKAKACSEKACRQLASSSSTARRIHFIWRISLLILAPAAGQQTGVQSAFSYPLSTTTRGLRGAPASRRSSISSSVFTHFPNSA